jgi:hypothetical protein
VTHYIKHLLEIDHVCIGLEDWQCVAMPLHAANKVHEDLAQAQMDTFGGTGKKAQGIAPDNNDGQYNYINKDGVNLRSLAVDLSVPLVKTLKQVLAWHDKVG